MSYIFTDIVYKNEDNIGGIPLVLYYAQQEDVLDFPLLADSASVTTLSSAAKLTGALVFKTGKKLSTIEITDGKGSITAKGVGEMGGRSSKTELKILVDKLTEEISGFNRLAQNGRFVFLVKDLNKANRYQVIGRSKDFPAKLKDSEMGTGEGTEGKRGASFTFEANDLTFCFMDITDVELAALLAPAP